MKRGSEISPATGRLGVLIPGMGAVSTTFIAGVFAVLKGLGKPIGSLSQMGTLRLGKRTDNIVPAIKDSLPLTELKDLVFGGWDIFEENMYQAAVHAGVLEKYLLEQVRPELEAITPMRAVFDPEYVRRLNGTYIKTGKNKMDLADQLRTDIREFKSRNEIERVVMIWCGSTEIFSEPTDTHHSLKAFEKGLIDNDPAIAPSMIYAYAALSENIPFANGTPNLAIDIPALEEMAESKRVPICGKDLKTGQTLMKTILAPGLKARMLGLQGWFSTNILGNRDGEVLDEPMSFKSKEMSKLGVLEHILQPDIYPDLYKDFYHKIRINYYPPRGDNKEGWDNIDIFGWLGYPMQIKVDFLCKDSILAAPLVLDLALFLDFAQRAGMSGIQEWLSFYFKSPMVIDGLYPEHDLFIQLTKFKNTLRFLMEEDLITHLGLNYYGELQ